MPGRPPPWPGSDPALERALHPAGEAAVRLPRRAGADRLRRDRRRALHGRAHLRGGSDRAGSHVLDVGTGSGYRAAVFAELGARVLTIERVPELAARATLALDASGNRDRATVHVGDGTLAQAAVLVVVTGCWRREIRSPPRAGSGAARMRGLMQGSTIEAQASRYVPSGKGGVL
ncbi:MAG: hypothetical protein KJ051_01720 [Thermoleophilia bacterium]|nr:hypothetical protein [Thermoleophilia bacterium]